MNRIVYDEKEFVVGFQHEVVSTVLHGDVPQTTCFIKVGPVGCLDKDKVMLASAKIKKHSADNENRVLARTVALTRALENIPSHEIRSVLGKNVNIRRRYPKPTNNTLYTWATVPVENFE